MRAKRASSMIIALWLPLSQLSLGDVQRFRCGGDRTDVTDVAWSKSGLSLTAGGSDGCTYLCTLKDGSVEPLRIADVPIQVVGRLSDDRCLVVDKQSHLTIIENGSKTHQKSAFRSLSNSGRFALIGMPPRLHACDASLTIVKPLTALPKSRHYEIGSDGQWIVCFDDRSIEVFSVSEEKVLWKQSGSRVDDLHSPAFSEVLFREGEAFAVGIATDGIGAGVAICDVKTGGIAEFFETIAGVPVFDLSSSGKFVAARIGKGI